MALPKLNVLPTFELKIPSTGKKARFRPYLVKEEKLLLLAYESKDLNQIVDAMVGVIGQTAESDIDLKSLTTFDVEYLFTQIRAKSVGEVIRLNLKCDNVITNEEGEEKVCGFVNEVSVAVDKIEVVIPKVEKIIKLTDQVSVEMKWPSYRDIMKGGILEDAEDGHTSDTLLSLASKCIGAVLTPENRYDAKDSTDKELIEFIESMTNHQFEQLTEFMNSMPKMETEVNYTCAKCGKQHQMKFEGLADFF